MLRFCIGARMKYLDKILKLVKQGKIKTRYSHDNRLSFQNQKIMFEVDCSGLLEFWLGKRHPEALKEIYDYIYKVRAVDKTEIQRLYSFDIYDFFAHLVQNESRYWQVAEINEVFQTGDVIAFVKEGERNRFGHVALVQKELGRNAEKITVRVIDSSQVEHIDDWRQTKENGIGEGSLEIHCQSGSVTAVCYTPDCIKIRKVLVGRLKK